MELKKIQGCNRPFGGTRSYSKTDMKVVHTGIPSTKKEGERGVFQRKQYKG